MNELPFDLLCEIFQSQTHVRETCKLFRQLYDESNTSLCLKSIDELNIVSQTPNLETLEVRGVDDYCIDIIIKNIKNIKKLKNLIIQRVPFKDIFWLSNTHINYISSCIGLESLYINSRGLSDISTIGECKSLKSLILKSKSIINFNPLKECKLLKELSLSECYHLNDISFIKNLTELEYLNIDDCFLVKDINILEHCEKLRELSMNFCKNIRDISILKHCYNLEYLNIDKCYDIENISVLRMLNLKKLSLSCCHGILDFTPLKNCTTLEYLNVSYNGRRIHLDTLPKCKFIESFTIFGNTYLDLSNLLL